MALGRGRVLLGSVLCAGAGLVRPTGVALVVAVVVAALASGDRRRGALAVVVAPLGVVGYLGWVALRTGSLTGWADRQHAGWGTGFDGGAATWTWLRTIPTRGALAIDLVILAAAIACAVTVGVLLRRRRTADAAYVGAVLVLALGHVRGLEQPVPAAAAGAGRRVRARRPGAAAAADAGAGGRPGGDRGGRLLRQRLPAHELPVRAVTPPAHPEGAAAPGG